MISVRRTQERHHSGRRKHDVWRTFAPQERTDLPADGFSVLQSLNEMRLRPGGSVPRHPCRDVEIITYVHEGAVSYEDSGGHSGVVHAGEFQCSTAGRGIRRSETNPSRTDWAHLFQLWLRPSELGLQPAHGQKRFSVAERRSRLCVVASADGRGGSLHIHQDALAYSSILYPGQHVVHELSHGRCAWLHVVRGEVTLGDVVLTSGDGAGITSWHAVSLTARQETEILLIDIGAPAPGSPQNGGAR